jgi:hypothetical protein
MGNRYLIPLVGGSGGGGALWGGADNNYYGGGAGGGALLIASSTGITVNGSISAIGGNGLGATGVGGGGSGGAIRLVAPTLSGNGHLDVRGGTGFTNPAVAGSPGWVRLEGYVISDLFTLDAGSSFVTRGSPVDPTNSRPRTFVRITAIDGIAVPTNPSGSFNVPDVSITNGGPVAVQIEATGIPPGTVVTLHAYTQTPADSTTVNLPTAQATLTVTLQSSTGTATFTFPYGFSRAFIRASWTQ